MVGNAFQGLLIYLMFALEKKKILALKSRVSSIFTDQTTLCTPNTDEVLINREQICNNDVKNKDSIDVI